MPDHPLNTEADFLPDTRVPAGQQLLDAGAMVQWYRIESVLGRGGFGVTYLATDTNLDRQVAIKEYLPPLLIARDSEGRVQPLNESVLADFDRGLRRFTSEARILVKFAHPSIVQVYSVFEANGTAYLVMEFERGEPLQVYLADDHNRSETELRRLFLAVAEGLQQVHARGYLHRDIKPSNLIVRSSGVPVLIDFGSARASSGVLETSVVSAGYAPLEQYQEGSGMQVGPWTDIYALAATLYYAVVGTAPVAAISRLAALAGGLPDPLIPAGRFAQRGYSADFLEAIDTGLRFDVEARPESLELWLSQLDRAPLVSATPGNDFSALGPNRELRARHLQHARRRQSRIRWATPGQQRPLRWWLAGMAFLALGVGGWSLNNWLGLQRVEQMVETADQAFSAGNFADQALPLYRQVLNQQPDHGHADQRVTEILRLLETRIRSVLQRGQLDSAAREIGLYEQAGGNRSSVRKFSETLAVERALAEKLRFASKAIDAGDYSMALELTAAVLAARPQHAGAQTLRRQAQSLERKKRLAAEPGVRLQTTPSSVIANTPPHTGRVKEANARLHKRRQAFNSVLTRAEHLLDKGKLKPAQQQLAVASGYQFDDARLAKLQQRLQRELAQQLRSMTADELGYARRQFASLQRAIEQKNIAVIRRLSDFQSARGELFLRLLDKYLQANIEMINFSTSTQPVSASVILRIRDLALSNGDVVYPSDAYRDTPLKLRRLSDRWSKIIW